MTPSSLHELIDSIRALLDGHPGSVVAEVVALEYAGRCREVNERLGRLAPMLAGGGEIQALQLAEQPPRVLDLAVALSFGGEVNWQEFCRNHGHEIAPLIDARTLEDLLGVVEKGISPNHPLYKDYRSAVSSRNDAKAFELIRIITRLNPGDENAAREIKRLERKALQAALAELRAALAAGNAGEVLALMSKVEQVGDLETYSVLPEWREAATLRQKQRREAAWARMPELLKAGETEMITGNWRYAAVSYSEYALLFETYGFAAGSPELSERAGVLEGQLTKHRNEAERISRVKRLLAEMLATADEVETRAVTAAGLTPEYAGPVAESLARDWRELVELRGEIPAGPGARIDATRARLSQTIERGRSSRRLRLAGAAVGVTLFLLLVAGIGLLALRASGHAKMLADLQAKQSTGPLADLLARVDQDESLLLKFPSLGVAAADARLWLETAAADLELTDQELSRLERGREENFAGVPSVELHARLEEVAAMASRLPPDKGKAVQSRLLVLANEGDRVLQGRRESLDGEARELLGHWASVLEAIDYQDSVVSAREAVEDSGTALAPFLALAGHKTSVLRLPASTEAGIEDLSNRLGKVSQQVAAVAEALAGLDAARSPDAYRSELAILADLNFREAQAARLLVDSWPDDERMKAFLIFRSDLTAMKAAENDSGIDLPLPVGATRLDREVLGALMKSETLNGLWEVAWKNGNGTMSRYLSRKELPRTTLSSWSGMLAPYPRHASSPLKFVELQFSNADAIKVEVNRLSPVSAMMEQLDLARLLDDTGTEFRSSVLPLVDRVTRAVDASPLARAYVLSRLHKMIRGREIAWGLHYCPEMIDDLRIFGEVEASHYVSENSWLLEEKPENYKPWEAYFAERTERAVSINLRKMKSAASSGLKNPVVLAGRIAADGAVMLPASRASRLLMGIGIDHSGFHGPCLVGIVAAGSEVLSPATPLLPFSPLLCIEIPEADQIFIQSIHASLQTAEATTSNP
jgi:hypothetical protein